MIFFNKNDLRELGNEFSSSVCTDEKVLYQKGVEQFKVNIHEMIDLLKSNFEGKYFTVVAGDNDDGINNLISDKSKNDILSPNQGWAVRADVLKYTDALFTTNERTIKIFNGTGTEKETNFVKQKCGGLKPCFEESDAHKFNSTFGKRWTWIKAEPSFDGLYQTKFEPIRRVKEAKYNLHNPNLVEANHYIKSITIKDPYNNFQPQIVFNSGLNTIIGGKSSGKSLLLYQLAQGCKSPESLNKIEKGMVTPFSNYKKLNLESKITLGNDKEVDQDFDIDYYPQLYINKISENFKNKELQKIIDKSLTNDNIYSSLEQFKINKNKYEQAIQEYVNAYHTLSVQCKNVLKQNRQLGEEKDIGKNIQIIDQKYQELMKELNISETENKQYRQQNKELESIREKRNELLEIKKKKQNKIQRISCFADHVRSIFSSELEYEDQRDLLNITSIFYDNLEKFIKDITNQITKVENQINDIENEIKQINSSLKPILEKLNRKSELDENRKQKYKLQTAKKSVKENKKAIQQNKSKQKDLLGNIRQNLIDFIGSTNKILDRYDKYKISESLSLKLDLYFDQSAYQTKIFELFDQRKVSKAIQDGVIDSNYLYEKCFSNKWFEFIKNSLSGNYDKYLKKNVSPEDLLNNLGILPINMPKNIIKEDDPLDKMSPGKRAIVVLELLLEKTSSAKNPILIDQPEDNLDNRSISTDLVKLLRKISLTRQVIIVTHNANLVVLSDADEVIVANQDPEIKENIRYRFEYITGSLENSQKKNDKNGKFISKSIRNDVTDILEGGIEAFKTRERKYLLN